MKKYTNDDPRMTIGLDLGDKESYLTLLDEEGEVIEQGRIKTRETTLQKRFSGLARARIALEVGTHSGWVSRLLQSLGHEVIVANPRKLRLIYENKSKDDRVDSEYLARVARVDPKLLSPIRHRSRQAQTDTQLLRARHNLVSARTQLINYVRSSVKVLGQRLPSCSAASFASSAGPHLPEELKETLEPMLAIIAELTGQIRSYDRKIEQWCSERYPETKLLRHIRGVGPLTALAFILTLQDPHRFARNRDVGPFLGLCPKRDQSGSQDPQLRISKEGDGYLRQLLVSCAHYLLGPFGVDCDLRRHGERIAARGGKNAKKRAVVAVARKLAVVMLSLWRSGEVYDPLYNSERQRAA